VVETRKGSTTAEIRVLEDVCPNLEVRPGQEWVLFASRWDPRYGPESGGEHFFTQGGPQGQVRFTSGKVSGRSFASRSWSTRMKHRSTRSCATCARRSARPGAAPSGSRRSARGPCPRWRAW
jgi:hypothetical protein